MNNLRSNFFIFLIAAFSNVSFAQETTPMSDLNSPPTTNTVVQAPASPLPSDEEIDQIEAEIRASYKPQKKVAEKNPKVQVLDNSSLSKLEPFSEVAVLTRKYFPKTERFQASAALTGTTNDAFFNNYGVVARLGYHFNENWGAELNYMSLNSTTKDSTNGLTDIGVTTTSLVSPKSYMGADIQYYPIYGKMAYLNKSIIPFDLYFGLGGGQTTISTGRTSSTFRLSTGELFAITRSLAFRWDFNWNFYSAPAIDGSSQSINNLFLCVGFSYFFPEAKYR